MDDKDFYSPAELAERWGVSVKTVYRLIETAELQATRIGGQHRISRAEVARYEQPESTGKAARST